MGNKAKIREDAMSLNPIDDALFVKMAEDKAFCEEILQVILSDKELVVLQHRPQLVLKNLQGRSCVLDCECILGDGRHVNVEVQRSNADDHQRRMRYNGSLLSVNVANPGDKFCDVPDVIVILIAQFDVFSDGCALYHVDRVVRESGRVVNNGLQEIYVNAVLDDGSDVAGLMKVFTQDSAYDDERFPATSKRKRLFKTTEEGIREMCEVIERNREEGRMEGRAEGRIEGALRTLISMVRKNRITKEEAAEEASMSLAEFEKALASQP
ncbi:PD-(D/E)XK nuclease family transposase [Anaerovibrio sp.]|uniref:PD-(D/E)XK nuclease family transposase n=1 Tax=Anaerovibrio sp. TaxID=1872532 RepID=UPI003F14B19A